MDFSSTFVLILLASASVAAFMQRVSGFGFGIFIMTLLPLFMPSYGEATALSGLLAVSQSIYVAICMRKYIVWKRVVPMLLVFCIVSYFCIGTVASLNKSLLMHILGVALILLSIYFLFFSSKIHIRQSLPMQLAMGSVSGVMGGFFGMQGPPAVLYYVESEPDKMHYSAQTQVYFVAGNLFMTVIRWKNHFVTAAVAHSWLIGIVGVIVGTIIGTVVFNKVSSEKLKKIIYGYMAVCGVVFLFK